MTTPGSPSPASPFRLRALIAGRVQAVGFRAFAQSKADLLGVTGWVRNWNSGEVEVLAEGARPILDDFLLYLRRGPAGASVTAVRVEWQPATGEFVTFSVIRSWPG